MKSVFSIMSNLQTNRSTQTTSRSLANEVNICHREPLGKAAKTIDFHTESHQNQTTISLRICKISASYFHMIYKAICTQTWGQISGSKDDHQR